MIPIEMKCTSVARTGAANLVGVNDPAMTLNNVNLGPQARQFFVVDHVYEIAIRAK